MKGKGEREEFVQVYRISTNWLSVVTSRGQSSTSISTDPFAFYFVV